MPFHLMSIVHSAFINTWKVFLLFVLFVLSGNVFVITMTAECQDVHNSWKFALNDEYYEKLQPACGVNHPHPPSANVKERVELHLLPQCAFMEGYRVNFTFRYEKFCMKENRWEANRSSARQEIPFMQGHPNFIIISARAYCLSLFWAR